MAKGRLVSADARVALEAHGASVARARYQKEIAVTDGPQREIRFGHVPVRLWEVETWLAEKDTVMEADRMTRSRGRPPPGPQLANLSPVQIRAAIPQLETRIRELEGLNVDAIR